MPEATPQTDAAAVVAAVVDQNAPAPTPPVEKPPERDHMAERFAQLAKQTKQIAQEKQKIAQERAERDAALKAREDALTARASKAEELEKLRANAARDPESFLRSFLGEDYYDKLTELRLTGKPPAAMEVQAVREETKAELERVRKENEDRWQKAEEERKAQAEEQKKALQAEQRQIIDNFHAETVDFVKANPEKYELINLNDAQEMVVQVIEGTFARTKRIMTASEAADAVEKELESRLERNFQSKKWSARQSTPTEERASESARTITNAMGGTSGAPSAGAPGSVDRYAAAAAAMRAAQAAAAPK